MNTKMIRYIVGSVIQLEAAFLLIPAVTAILYRESVTWVFLASALFCLVVGSLLRAGKPKNTTIYSSDGYAIVALCWIALSVCGAIPLHFSGYFPNPVDALFEIVSGFTTTGATILSDVECLPRGVLMWRSFSHWIGGMGILVFMLAVLPTLGASSMYLMKAESPGPSVGKLVPKLRGTAKILYLIYFALTVTEFLLLVLFGCPVFDSLNLSFATAGTGGFGVLNSSAGDYNMAIQTILTIFMVLFGVNFNVYFLIVCGKVKEAMKSHEVRAYLGIILVASLVVAGNIHQMFDTVGETLLHSFFQVGSVITTTGFSTVDFNLWPELSRTILVCLMFVGACAGSTGGGMKVSRILIMLNTVRKELAYVVHPREVRKNTFEGKTVEHEVIRNANVYVMAYLVILGFSVLVVSLDNFDGVTNFTAVASAMNNIGPGLNLAGPTQNFSIFSNLSKLVLTFDMLAGRLELFPMLVLIKLCVKRKNW